MFTSACTKLTLDSSECYVMYILLCDVTYKVRRRYSVIVSKRIEEHSDWKLLVFRAKGTAGAELGCEAVNRRHRLEPAVQGGFLETTQKSVTRWSIARQRPPWNDVFAITDIFYFLIGFFQRHCPWTWRCVQFEKSAAKKL